MPLSDSIKGTMVNEKDKEAYAAFDQAAVNDLNSYLQNTGIDWNKKYQELSNMNEGAPVTQTPSPLRAAFAALGSPTGAPRLLSQAIDQRHEDEGNKFSSNMRIQEALLTAKAQQEAAKGNYAAAVKSHAEAMKASHTADRIKSENESALRREENKAKADEQATLIQKRSEARINEIKAKYEEAYKVSGKYPANLQSAFNKEVDAAYDAYTESIKPNAYGVEPTDEIKDIRKAKFETTIQNLIQKYDTLSGKLGTNSTTKTQVVATPSDTTVVTPNKVSLKGTPEPKQEQGESAIAFQVRHSRWVKENK